jgi:hypothetical protein
LPPYAGLGISTSTPSPSPGSWLWFFPLKHLVTLTLLESIVNPWSQPLYKDGSSNHWICINWFLNQFCGPNKGTSSGLIVEVRNLKQHLGS